MENKRHFSLDIETLSLEPNAFILSIGCVQFDIETGKIIKEFHEIVDHNSIDKRPGDWAHCDKLDFYYEHSWDVDDDTIDWWLKVNPKYFNELFYSKDSKHIKDVLISLENFIEHDKNDFYIWTVGGLDPAAIEFSYKQFFGVNPFIKHKGCWREIRTYESALQGIISRDDIPMEEGMKHNALDDAKIQAKQVSVFYNKLKEIKDLYHFRMEGEF